MYHAITQHKYAEHMGDLLRWVRVDFVGSAFVRGRRETKVGPFELNTASRVSPSFCKRDGLRQLEGAFRATVPSLYEETILDFRRILT